MTYGRELELTADRLRQLSEGRLRPQQAAVYAVLDGLTDREVPRLAPRAWGDQLLVVGREISEEQGAPLIESLRRLRRSFDLTV